MDRKHGIFMASKSGELWRGHGSGGYVDAGFQKKTHSFECVFFFYISLFLFCKVVGRYNLIEK